MFDEIARAWRERGGRVIEPRPAAREELLRVHTPDYVASIEAVDGRAAMLDPDTFTSPESVEVARLAAGAAVQAVEHALATGETAFALVRPPGHHAEAAKAMGFCLFNNVAVAAAAAIARGLSRVAIVDIDVHHGNGTQWIFYADARVFYASTHQFPFYPGTGAADETGTGAGQGFTLNIPLAAGARDADYADAYKTVAAALEEYSPELLIISAGFDAHADDPLASMRMTSGGYAGIVGQLRDAVSCPIALVTEGGYDLDALAACLDAVIAVLGV